MKKYSKTTIIISILLGLLIAGVCIFISEYIKNCDKDQVSELNEIERKYVGKWELEDITIISAYQAGNVVGQSFQQWYPSEESNQYAASNTVFNTMCEKYYGKTTLFFDNKKFKNTDEVLNSEEIKGSLTIGNSNCNFYWHSKGSGNFITMGAKDSYHSVCKLDVIKGKTEIKNVYVSSASINSKNKLIFNVSSSTHSSNEPNNEVLYIFKKVS